MGREGLPALQGRPSPPPLGRAAAPNHPFQAPPPAGPAAGPPAPLGPQPLGPPSEDAHPGPEELNQQPRADPGGRSPGAPPIGRWPPIGRGAAGRRLGAALGSGPARRPLARRAGGWSVAARPPQATPGEGAPGSRSRLPRSGGPLTLCRGRRRSFSRTPPPLFFLGLFSCLAAPPSSAALLYSLSTPGAPGELACHPQASHLSPPGGFCSHPLAFGVVVHPDLTVSPDSPKLLFLSLFWASC